MGYCLVYKTTKKTSSLQKNRVRVAMLTFVSALMFVFLINFFWPNGKILLEEFLFGERVVLVAAAMDGFVMDLENGVAFGEAVRIFVSKLLKN